MFKTIVVIVVALLSARVAAQSVHYEGDSIRLRLADAGKGSFAGEIVHKGATYSLTATGRLDDQLNGSFVADQNAFAFVARSTADGLTFETGGKTYRLKRAAAPAVVPSQITFKRVEIRDAQMGNQVSHTMYIPEGWTFEGRTEWSQGTIVYPQQSIEVRSPEGFTVRFQPAMHLAYSEMDPNFARQLKQTGLWNPQIHQESSGIKPPDDIGEFLVGYLTRNNKAVRDVRLASQKRDRETEAAMRDKFPLLAANATEWHVVTLAYQRDDTTFREEISLIYTRNQPLRGPAGTFWTYSIMTSAMIAGPADGFAQARPLLQSIANSLAPTPRWQIASQQVLAEIQAARHEQNMAAIRNWGDSIRQAGEQNSKISDARMKQWMADQKADDEKQRERVRNIYDIYTHTTVDGSRIAVPLGHNHVYKTSDGRFIASEHPIENNSTLTPVEFK